MSEATETSVMGWIAEDKAGLVWGFFPWLLLHNPRLLHLLTFLNSLCLPVSQKKTEADRCGSRLSVIMSSNGGKSLVAFVKNHIRQTHRDFHRRAAWLVATTSEERWVPAPKDRGSSGTANDRGLRLGRAVS